MVSAGFDSRQGTKLFTNQYTFIMKKWKLSHSPAKEESGTSLRYVPEFRVLDHDGNIVCRVRYASKHYFKDREEWKKSMEKARKTARLIASAPDMYNRLQATKKELQRTFDLLDSIGQFE